MTATVLGGILTYVILAIVSRTVDSAAFDAFSVFWSITLIVGFGFFLPVEQEAARLGRDPDAAAALMPAMMRLTVLLAVAVSSLAAASVPLLMNVLGLTPGLAVACVFVVVASAVQFAARGRLLAEMRNAEFANTLILDTVLRVVLLGAVAVAVVASSLAPATVWYAAALVVAIVAAHAWAVPWTAWRPQDGAVFGRLGRAVAVLIPTGLCAQILVNGGVVAVQALADAPGLAGAFQASSTLARVPLAIITPIQAMLVGPLAALALEGDHHAIGAMMRRVAVGASLLAVVGAAVGWLLGPWLVELIFGPGRALPGTDIAILVAGVAVHVALIIFTQAVIAAGRHRWALAAWASALGAAAAVFAVLVPFAAPALTAGLSFGFGSLAGAAIAYAMLVRLARAAEHPHPIA